MERSELLEEEKALLAQLNKVGAFQLFTLAFVNCAFLAVPSVPDPVPFNVGLLA